jgi:hypothetical protein
MIAAWQAIANAKPPAGLRPWADPRLLWASLALTGLLLLLAVVFALLRRWQKHLEEPPLNANEQLAYFRELFENGEISQAEFDRIRAKLAKQLQVELEIPPKPAGPAASPEPPAPAAGTGQPPS